MGPNGTRSESEYVSVRNNSGVVPGPFGCASDADDPLPAVGSVAPRANRNMVPTIPREANKQLTGSVHRLRYSRTPRGVQRISADASAVSSLMEGHPPP